MPEQPHALNAVISEGVAHLDADAWQSAGHTGAGAKVAVIDGGFIGLAARKTSGELPADALEYDPTGLGMETGTSHGCGVAEIVHDMAPSAELHLIPIGDESDLEAAKDYCLVNGIHVVNHSMAWYGFNFFDGAAYASMAPSPVSIAVEATAQGILWVNAAGNGQQKHALISWQDGDGDDQLDWTPSHDSVNQIGYLNANATVVLKLTWNDWPTTNQDFDLFLVRRTGAAWTTETYSGNPQTGSQPPTESIGVRVSQTAYYGVVILKYSATATPTFILRSWYQSLQYKAHDQAGAVAGSVASPADAQSVLAVGAIDEDKYTTGPVETFSSLGPNNGAYTANPTVMKPDLCAPDDTASVTYGGGFRGTSASSPHVAGAAALVKGAYPTYDPARLREFLELRAIDMGVPGEDNNYGRGRLELGPAPAFSEVWVDFAFNGLGEGTQTRPFSTLGEAVHYVDAGGTVRIRAGTSAETLGIDKAMQVLGEGGTVTIGAE
jgi:subtilisin family serine protease